MRKIFFINSPVILTLLLMSACSSSPVIPLYEYPPDWKDVTVREKTITDYSKYISGRKFFLDPGHGGEDRRNKNKEGSAPQPLRVPMSIDRLAARKLYSL